jgi:hypothetical protein
MEIRTEAEARRALVEIALKVVAYNYGLINLQESERNLVAQYPTLVTTDLKGSAIRILRDALLQEGAFTPSAAKSVVVVHKED